MPPVHLLAEGGHEALAAEVGRERLPAYARRQEPVNEDVGVAPDGAGEVRVDRAGEAEVVPLGGGEVAGAEVRGRTHAPGGEDAEELVEVRVEGSWHLSRESARDLDVVGSMVKPRDAAWLRRAKRVAKKVEGL